MAGNLKISIKTDENQAQLQDLFKFNSDDNYSREAALALSGYFKDLAFGRRRGVIDVQTADEAPARASATFTFVSVISTDTFTISGTTFTFTSTPTLSTDVEVDGASDALDATAACNAINAHSTISKLVLATVASNVVTVTAREPGVVGNAIAVSDADTTITTSAANLSGGTGGAQDSIATFYLHLS